MPDGWELHEEPGTTLLPGLIETHTHLCADNSPRALDQLGELDDDAVDAIVRESLRLELAAGVTTVRDLGDARWAVVDRRPDHGPRVLAAGPPITSVQGHCWNMGGEAGGADALRAAVRERAERGADVVKIMLSGGVMTVTTDYLAHPVHARTRCAPWSRRRTGSACRSRATRTRCGASTRARTQASTASSTAP